MGFFDIYNRTHDEAFEDMTHDEIDAILAKDTYGNFKLTEAIRLHPSFIPHEGYRHDFYHESDHKKIPVLIAAVSREKLFDLFLSLTDQLGDTVDVVLETSHYAQQTDHTDLYREHMDLSVLQSKLHDYVDLLLNDGSVGIAVVNTETLQEVQFDAHKFLALYGTRLSRYERILKQYGVREIPSMKIITEAAHLHVSDDKYMEQFERIRSDVIGDFDFDSVHDEDWQSSCEDDDDMQPSA